MASEKVYLVKNLSPWMLDELLAFADLTSYTVLLLRAPESKYAHQLSLLRNKGIQIITNPYRFNLSIHKLFIALRMILRYPAAFMSGYSAVVGWKSLLSCCVVSIPLHEVRDLCQAIILNPQRVECLKDMRQ